MGSWMPLPDPSRPRILSPCDLKTSGPAVPADSAAGWLSYRAAKISRSIRSPIASHRLSARYADPRVRLLGRARHEFHRSTLDLGTAVDLGIDVVGRSPTASTISFENTINAGCGLLPYPSTWRRKAIGGRFQRKTSGPLRSSAGRTPQRSIA